MIHVEDMGRLIGAYRGVQETQRVQAFRKGEMQETRESKGGIEELADTSGGGI